MTAWRSFHVKAERVDFRTAWDSRSGMAWAGVDGRGGKEKATLLPWRGGEQAPTCNGML